MTRKSAINFYSQVKNQTTLEGATPHKLILMLFNGAQERLATAKGHMQRGEIEAKSSRIDAAIKIIEGLRNTLDFQNGGEISENLDSLYEYMLLRLVQANMKNDPEIIDEVLVLIREVAAGWSSIKDQVGG
ncbi:MAG: flagellar export chaperone FliS [Gammaproteobacteria bacterium]|jgi:flagellar secretion chaperone FliS|nr:flagellar export chaperone FliS [Gammaproteobacteria bacterium]